MKQLYTLALLIFLVDMAMAQPVITLTTQPGRCPSSGSITVNATGTSGTPLYSIKRSTDTDFSPEQLSNVFNNLASGTYTVAVHDAFGVTLSNPVTLTNAPYTVMSIPSILSANSIVTACDPDGSIELTMTGGRPPYTYHLRNGPTVRPDVVDTLGTRVRFTQLESGNYFIDVTDSCGNILTQSTAIVVRSLYNLKDTILGSVDGLSGPTQWGGNCVDSLSFSTNNLLLKSVNGTVLFQRDVKHMPSNYPMQARILYQNGAVTDTTPWQSVFSKFPLPTYSPDSTTNKYRVQIKHPCNDTNIVTSPLYTIPYPYQTRSGFCLPSIVHTTPGYYCGPLNIHLVDISNSSNVRDYTWDGVGSSFTFNTSDWGTAKFSVFITIGSNTYKTENVSAGQLATVSVATDSWDYLSNLYCDFSTGRIRSYGGAFTNNTIPITYSILSGPELRDPVTSAAALPVFIWDTLPKGNYTIKVDYGGCRADTLIRRVAPPYTGFDADSLSYRLGSTCGKYVITGTGWYIDTLSIRVTDTLAENDTLLGLAPGLRQYTARFLRPDGTFGISSLNTYSTQPFAITGTGGSGEVGPGTYNIVFMSTNHSENHCYYLERTITIPPYIPVTVDVAASGGVACDSLTGDIYVGTVGGNIYISTQGNSVTPFSYRIKPRDSTDAFYTPWQTSPLFENKPVGVYTAQVFDSCGYTATTNIELLGADTVLNINVVGTTVTGNQGEVCQYTDISLELSVVGPASDVKWVLSGSTDTIPGNTYTIDDFGSADAGKYYVTFTSGGCSRRDSVILDFNLAPVYTASGGSICSGTSLDLTTLVTGLSANSSLKLYSDSTALVEITNPILDPDSTTTYYAQTTDNITGCKSLVTALPIVVNYKPAIGTFVSPPPACNGQALLLTNPIVTEQGTPATNEGWTLDGIPFDPVTTLSLADNGKLLRYFAQSACGDSITAPVTISVNAKPEFAFDDSVTVPAPNTVDLSTLTLASGDTTGLTLTYYDSLYTPLTPAEVAAADEGTYHIMGSISQGCSDTSSVRVTVDAIGLPVTLVSFTVNKNGNDAVLHWITSFEQNSNRFEIEQGIDGVYFNNIGFVAAAGNSNTDLNYNFRDVNILRYGANRIYYRLKQVDNDGQYLYSTILRINASNENVFKASIAPNPATSVMNLILEGVKERETLSFELMNTNGMLIYKEQIIANGSSMVKTIQRPAVSAGLYFYKITRTVNRETVSGRLMMQ